MNTFQFLFASLHLVLRFNLISPPWKVLGQKHIYRVKLKKSFSLTFLRQAGLMLIISLIFTGIFLLPNHFLFNFFQKLFPRGGLDNVVVDDSIWASLNLNFSLKRSGSRLRRG